MSGDRPPRAPSSRITRPIAEAILRWLELNVSESEPVRLVALYLEEEVHGDTFSALIELEERYELPLGSLTNEFARYLTMYARGEDEQRRASSGLVELDVEADDRELIRLLSEGLKAAAFLFCLPEKEFVTALELAAHRPSSRRDSGPDVFRYLEKVFRTRGLPYTASVAEGIRYVGEPTVREHAIEPALVALANPRLVTASAEFEKALTHLRRGEFKDAGRSAGDAVETTMAVLLADHGHPQPRTPHGTDLTQAKDLFDRLKSKVVGVLNEDRDKELIYAPMKVRNACGHGAGANPKPADQAYIEAGVAAAAIAITYLASKFK